MWGKQKSIVFASFVQLKNNLFDRIEVPLCSFLYPILKCFLNHSWQGWANGEWMKFALYRRLNVRGEKRFWVYPTYMHERVVCTTRVSVDVWVRWRNGRANSLAASREDGERDDFLTRHLALISVFNEEQRQPILFYQMVFSRRWEKNVFNLFAPMRPHLWKWAWHFWHFFLLSSLLSSFHPFRTAVPLEAVGRSNLMRLYNLPFSKDCCRMERKLFIKFSFKHICTSSAHPVRNE